MNTTRTISEHRYKGMMRTIHRLRTLLLISFVINLVLLCVLLFTTEELATPTSEIATSESTVAFEPLTVQIPTFESIRPNLLEIMYEQRVEEVPDITLYYTEEDANLIAQTLYRECRDMKSDTEKACVVWCMLNRVDSTDPIYPDTIEGVVTQPLQFAYYPDTPVYQEYLELTYDVLQRWNAEKNGMTDVGRVLPPEYLFFHGDWAKNPSDAHNYFRVKYNDYSNPWDYSLESPYET